jgi:hypothetical protein
VRPRYGISNNKLMVNDFWMRSNPGQNRSVYVVGSLDGQHTTPAGRPGFGSTLRFERERELALLENHQRSQPGMKFVQERHGMIHVEHTW